MHIGLNSTDVLANFSVIKVNSNLSITLKHKNGGVDKLSLDLKSTKIIKKAVNHAAYIFEIEELGNQIIEIVLHKDSEASFFIARQLDYELGL